MLQKVLSCNGESLVSYVPDVTIARETLAVDTDLAREVTVVYLNRKPVEKAKVKRERIEATYPPELRDEINTRVLKARELHNVLKVNRNLKREIYLRELRLFQFQLESFWDILYKIQKEVVNESALVAQV